MSSSKAKKHRSRSDANSDDSGRGSDVESGGGQGVSAGDVETGMRGAGQRQRRKNMARKAGPPPSGLTQFLRVVKNIVSTIVSVGAMIIVLWGILGGHAALAGPWYLHIPLLVFVVTLLAYLEGLQVAILALEHIENKTLRATPRAQTVHKLSTKGNNVQRFLVGRQFWVIFVVFVAAQITTFPTLQLPLPRWLFVVLIETGLPGALVVLALGQLMPQLITATHPVSMLNAPGSWLVVKFALTLEALGVTNFAWVVTWTAKLLCRLGHHNSVTAKHLTDRQRREREQSMDTVYTHESAQFLLVDVADDDDIYQAADEGLEGAELDDLPVEKSVAQDFVGWGFTPRPDKYPTPGDIGMRLVAAGKKVPRFLLPPHHPLHIPPHVVAYSLLRKGAEAYRKVDLDDGITTCPNCKAAVVRAPTTATTNAGGSGVGASRGTDDDDEHTTGESSDSDE